jgi:hypothetical protein
MRCGSRDRNFGSDRCWLPAIYKWREFAAAGGLMSYGSNITDTHRLVSALAGRILKITSPPICRCSSRRIQEIPRRKID